LKDEKLAEDLTKIDNAFHKLAAFRKNELKSMFFLAEGIWTFKLLRSIYGDKSLYIFGMRECRVRDAIPNIIL